MTDNLFFILTEDERIPIRFLIRKYTLVEIPVYFKYKGDEIKSNIKFDIWSYADEWNPINPDNPLTLPNIEFDNQLFPQNQKVIKRLYDEAKMINLIKVVDGVNEIKVVPQSLLNGWEMRGNDYLDFWTPYRGELKTSTLLNRRFNEYLKVRIR